MTTPWYVESFKEDYLKIYAHRTDEAAASEVNQIMRMIQMDPGASVLDLCCGNGRHSRQLSCRGMRVTGIDLSTVLLDKAESKNDKGHIRYFQSDVRYIPFYEEFDVVLNLFTSFGYFEETEENLKVFQAMSRALKQKGRFLIDFLNPQYVRQNLVPYSEREAEGLTIRERRQIDGHKVHKQIEIEDGGKPRVYEEQVRLFEFPEMQTLLNDAGLRVGAVYGDFNMSPYDAHSSERMIIQGDKL
jgi:SAM-dependent methyltransferase